MVNWGLNRGNRKPKTKIKKERTFKVPVEILTGIQLRKIKSLKLIGGAIEPIKHWRTKLQFSKKTKIACAALFRYWNSAEHNSATHCLCKEFAEAETTHSSATRIYRGKTWCCSPLPSANIETEVTASCNVHEECLGPL